jgi:type IV pilus assembly protein PilB
MAGLELKPKIVATEHQFLIPAQRAHVLCTLHLEKTVHGDRALIRFAESSPLVDEPLSFLAFPEEERIRISDRLNARAGGLILITSPHARTVSTLYASFLTMLGASEERDILSLERPNERRIRGVTPINCPSEEILLASLANASFMNPDVLGIQSIENGSILNRVINTAVRGTTVIGCFPAPDVKAAMACLHASRVDAMNIMRGIVGHMHVTEIPRLCPACRTAVEVPETLPQWARAIDSPWQRRAGCKTCQNTGYAGNVWVTEYQRPSLEKGDGSFEQIIPRSRDLLALAIGGEIDPRDYPVIE